MSSWVVPGFIEERVLGSGASGRVVAAIHELSGQPVAIKYLAPRLLDDPRFLADFRAEAEVLKSLDVPQIVGIYDYVEEPGRGAAIIMELVNGVSLYQMIKNQGATDAESALTVLKGSLLGLACAHGFGIVHRDYKPENVLVDDEGISKLADFGVAVKAGRHAPAAGTPLYMAPEQWAGAPPSPASDIYAATAVFFECLTSKPPFSGGMAQLAVAHETAPVPVEEVAEPLRGLIRRGMAKQPGHRPANASAFVEELEYTATPAYGPFWEERGRDHLKERAAALLLLLLGTTTGAGSGEGLANTVLGDAGHRKKILYGAAGLGAAAVLAIAGTTFALQGSGNAHHLTPSPAGSTRVVPAASPGHKGTGSGSPVSRPTSTTPSAPAPQPTTTQPSSAGPPTSGTAPTSGAPPTGGAPTNGVPTSSVPTSPTQGGGTSPAGGGTSPAGGGGTSPAGGGSPTGGTTPTNPPTNPPTSNQPTNPPTTPPASTAPTSTTPTTPTQTTPSSAPTSSSPVIQ